MSLLQANIQMADMASTCKPETPEERVLRKVETYNALPGNLDQEDGYNCDICKNKGDISYVGEPDAFGLPAEYIKPCKCCKVRNAIRRLNRSGLHDVVKKYTCDGYQVHEPWRQAIKDTAQRYCREGGESWFFIGGQSGAGKTHISTAIAVQLIRQGKAVRYMVWRDEAPRIKALVNEPEQYAALMKELKETDVLYIDDLFKDGKGADGQYHMPTPADVKLAFEIINYRYNNNGLPTVISCDRTLEELIDIDEPLAGRIAEKSKPYYCINLKPDRKKNWRLQGMIEF